MKKGIFILLLAASLGAVGQVVNIGGIDQDLSQYTFLTISVNSQGVTGLSAQKLFINYGQSQKSEMAVFEGPNPKLFNSKAEALNWLYDQLPFTVVQAWPEGNNLQLLVQVQKNSPQP